MWQGSMGVVICVPIVGSGLICLLNSKDIFENLLYWLDIVNYGIKASACFGWQTEKQASYFEPIPWIIKNVCGISFFTSPLFQKLI